MKHFAKHLWERIYEKAHEFVLHSHPNPLPVEFKAVMVFIEFTFHVVLLITEML